jgi:hypothetical protein
MSETTENGEIIKRRVGIEIAVTHDIIAEGTSEMTGEEG